MPLPARWLFRRGVHNGRPYRAKPPQSRLHIITKQLDYGACRQTAPSSRDSGKPTPGCRDCGSGFRLRHSGKLTPLGGLSWEVHYAAVPVSSPGWPAAAKATAAAGSRPGSDDGEIAKHPAENQWTAHRHFHRALYRQRNLVERTIDWLKQIRRIATWYEKGAENYLALLQIGALLLWL